MPTNYREQILTSEGWYGEFGGQYVSEMLLPVMQQLDECFQAARHDPEFLADLKWIDGYSCKRCDSTVYIKGKQLYSRRCSKCGYEADLMFNMEDERPKDAECPQCHEKAFNRSFKSSAIIVPFQWTKDQFRFDKRDRSLRKYR